MAHRFALDSETIEEMIYSFNGNPCYVVEFEQSAKIPTYVYCLAAGPFAEIKPKNIDFSTLEIPVRLFCRKSLA
jgi:aminopeptidase N